MKKKKSLFELQKSTISRLNGGANISNPGDDGVVRDSQFVTLCTKTDPTANTFCFVCPPHTVTVPEL